MCDIQKRQEEIVAEFALLEDPFDRYAYLLELAALLPMMSEERRQSLTPVAGCQSHVWLDIRAEDGSLVLEADSDTMLIRGIVYLLCRVLSGQPLGDAAEAELDFLQRSGIVPSLSADRRKGIGYVVREVQRRAAELRDASC